MINRKRIVRRSIIAMLIVLVLSHAPMAGAEPLRIGYFKVPPHAIPNRQGPPGGVAVMYFERIAREMKLARYEFILLPLNRLLLALEKNDVDMALLLARNAERAAKFQYPAEAFCMTKPSIAVSIANPLQRIRSTEELLPLSFHETPRNYRTAIMQDPRLNIEPLPGNDFTRRCYAMILAGRVDACYQPDHYPIQFEAAHEDFASEIKILYLPDPPTGLYSVFSRTSAPIYLQRYEMALAALKKRQSYGAVFEEFIQRHAEAQAQP